MHAVLQEARKLVPNDRNLINLRDQAYDIERTADLLYNTTKNALDFAIARRAEEEAQSSRKMAVSAYRLNLLAAFFFPLATLSAVFGTNMDHGLEHRSAPWPLLGLVVVGLLAGSILAAMVSRGGGETTAE